MSRLLLLALIAAMAGAGEAATVEQAWAACGLPQRRDADGVLHVATSAGDVAVLGRAALDEQVPGSIAALAAQVPGEGRWILRTGLLTGATLRSDDRLVCAAGILRRRDPPAPPPPEQLSAAMNAAADAAAAAISPELSAVGAESVRALLKRLAAGSDGEQAPGEFARRLVGSRWLDDLVAPAAAAALRAAVAAAAQPRPVELWEGAGCRLERSVDAFAREVWTWRTPETCRYLIPAAGPAYRPHADLHLAVTLPAAADPWRDAGQATGAVLSCGEMPLTRWIQGSALIAFPQRWEPAMRPGGANRLPGWPTPHLLLTAADGTPLRLCVADPTPHHRVLEVAAPADGGADAEDFLARAARTLEEPAALALVGDCFFQYVPDSPDPSRPLLIGEPERCGDIHQTSAQTLATTLGGRFRGDCDDLAEIYTDLLTRQGRLAHVMSLPGHAAAGCLLRDGEGWRFHVFHSGPASAWHADTAEGAVGAAYSALDRRDGRSDTSQVGVLLRFADANTRTPWVLSWRIYRDPDYARTLIAVERDWYYRTYHHAIAVMLALIAGGDHDSANYSELSGLYRRIGEWRASVAWRRRADAALGHPATPEHRLQEMSLLVRAGMRAEAAGLAQDIAHDLADLAERDPQRAAGLACTLAGWLDGDQAGLRRLLTEQHIRPWFDAFTPRVKAWIDRSFDPKVWHEDPAAETYRIAGNLLAGEFGLAPPATEDRSFADWWYGEIGALAQGKRTSPVYTAATPAWWLERRLGGPAMERLVAAAPDPPLPAEDRPMRFSGPLGEAAAAAWTRRNVSWLEGRLLRAAAAPASPRRDAALRGWRARIDAAEAFLAAHELSDPWQGQQAAQARLIAALVLGERERLAGCLERLGKRNDRAENESAASLIGAWADHMPEGGFAAALAAWHARIGSKPFALEIAWSALQAQAWDAAAVAAQAASAHWPDDAILDDEADRIADLAAQRRLLTLP